MKGCRGKDRIGSVPRRKMISFAILSEAMNLSFSDPFQETLLSLRETSDVY